MAYVLICKCVETTEFFYDEDKEIYVCAYCGNEIPVSEAGKYLIEENLAKQLIKA